MGAATHEWPLHNGDTVYWESVVIRPGPTVQCYLGTPGHEEGHESAGVGPSRAPIDPGNSSK